MSVISIRGATEHNLKNVSVDIPKQRLVSFTGVSGSGKTSLIFDTVFVEAFRRFAGATAAPVYLMGNSLWSQTSRPKYKLIRGLPPALGLSQQQGVAGKLSTVGTLCGATDLLRVYYAAFGECFCKNCDIPLRKYSFTQIVESIQNEFNNENVTFYAPIAEKRKGGFEKELEKFKQLGFSKIIINGNAFDLQEDDRQFSIDAKKLNTIEVAVDNVKVSTDKAKRIERAVLQAIEHGKGVVKLVTKGKSTVYNTNSACPQCGESAPKLDPRHFSHSSLGQCEACMGTGSQNEELPADLYPCSKCNGTRLNRSRPTVRVKGITFETLHIMKIPELALFVDGPLKLDVGNDKPKQRVYTELRRLVDTIQKIDLSHLNLNRAGTSLPPGDLQRLRLASMISNNLNGALYVLDEPCQGLTKVEVEHLVKILQNLIRTGASVISVEHHPSFLKLCDDVFVMGPGAGVHGGSILEQVAGKNFHEEKAKTETVALKSNLSSQPYIEFHDVRIRNINKKSITVHQGGVTLIRGPAGHGKSTFLEMCLYPVLDSIVTDKKLKPTSFFKFSTAKNLTVTYLADVRPGSMVRTSRKIVASALDILTHLRALFAQLPNSQVLGLSDAHFSWHSKHGQCESCEGRGYTELSQRFGASVRITCEACMGAKLKNKSLVPRYKGYNFADLMNLSLEEVQKLFENFRLVSQRLTTAMEFGLGYVKLGQGMDSLSGGELQRLTLTTELRRATLEGAWFTLFHPGTGLHAPDINVLGNLMRMMVDKGASFIALENREEFLPYADEVLEF